MKIGIIGSSGVLGSMLREAFTLSGYEVFPFSRGAERGGNVLDVLLDNSPNQLIGLDAVIYLAWDTTNRSKLTQSSHADAAGRWAKHCQAFGIRFLFVSTVLAQEKTDSLYGQFKYHAEVLVAQQLGKSVRVGLVADDALPLLLTKIRRVNLAHSWIPKLLDWPVYAVSSTTVYTSIEQILLNWPSEPCIWVAPSEPVSLAQIAAWGDAAPQHFKIFRSIGKSIANLPLRGRWIDAWRGLISHMPSSFDSAGCKQIGIDKFDWQMQLNPKTNYHR